MEGCIVKNENLKMLKCKEPILPIRNETINMNETDEGIGDVVESFFAVNNNH